MYSHFTNKNVTVCKSGLDAIGNIVRIEDQIVFVGSNGRLIKGTITDICVEELDDGSMKYASQYRLVDSVKNIPLRWYYKIDTDKNRHTEKPWTDVIKIIQEKQDENI